MKVKVRTFVSYGQWGIRGIIGEKDRGGLVATFEELDREVEKALGQKKAIAVSDCYLPAGEYGQYFLTRCVVYEE